MPESTYQRLCRERFASRYYIDAYNDAVDVFELWTRAQEIDAETMRNARYIQGMGLWSDTKREWIT